MIVRLSNLQMAGMVASLLAGALASAPNGPAKAQGSAFETNAQTQLDERCAEERARIEMCQQLALELKRRQAQDDTMATDLEDEPAGQNSTPRITQGEQRAAQRLRCALLPHEMECAQD